LGFFDRFYASLEATASAFIAQFTSILPLYDKNLQEKWKNGKIELAQDMVWANRHFEVQPVDIS
jgi:hypothetical protein